MIPCGYDALPSAVGVGMMRPVATRPLSAHNKLFLHHEIDFVGTTDHLNRLFFLSCQETHRRKNLNHVNAGIKLRE